MIEMVTGLVSILSHSVNEKANVDEKHGRFMILHGSKISLYFLNYK
jgi:hypothetical protein